MRGCSGHRTRSTHSGWQYHGLHEQTSGNGHDLTVRVGTMPEPGDIHILRRGILEVTRQGNFDPEQIVSYEAGYRVQPCSSVTLDLTAFVNYYDDFITSDRFGYVDWRPRYFITHWYFANNMDGKSYGVEAVVNWQAADWWKLQSTYTYLNYHFDPGSHDPLRQRLSKSQSAKPVYSALPD